MRIVTCDCCGQRMARWFTITPQIDASSQTMNVADLLCYTSRKELCEACYKQFLTQKKQGRLAVLDEIEEAMRIKCEEAKQKWRDSYKVTSNEYDEGYMDGWQEALDKLQKWKHGDEERKETEYAE